MKKVILESPYAGDVERNEKYARLCLSDSLDRSEAPLASHLLYTQVLDDRKAKQREQGIAAGLAWLEHADLMAVYEDYGVSEGMRKAIALAHMLKVPVEHRRIYDAGSV